MINLAQIKSLLLPGLRGVEGRYPQINPQWSQVFDSGTSNMALERTTEMRFLSLAQLKNEGGPIMMDNAAGERFIYNQEHIEYGLGFAVTRKAIEDNLYKDQFDPTVLNLAESFAQTKNIVGANLLNTATVYNALIGGDGKALCATDHPIDGGTWANRPTTDLNLNEAALEAGQLSIRYFPDQANVRMSARARKLIIPPQLEYAAIRLLKTELRPNTANNDVNAQVVGGFVPDGYAVMDYLTSRFAWFLKTDKKGLLYLQRRAFDTDMQVDFITQNLLVAATERYSFGYFNPRALWGSFPTA